MNFTVTVLGLGPLVEALHALASALRPSEAVLRAGDAAMNRINPLDNPEAGGAPAPVLAAALPQPPAMPLTLMQPAAPELPAFAVGFVPPGGAVAQVPPPPFTPALSTAAAAAPPTAPAAPSSTAVPPAPPAPAVPPVSAAPAPTAPVPPPVSAPGAGQFDSRGLPWDHRIHSSPSKATDPKPMNKDGSWRQKRGTADTYVKEVEALLRAAMAANGAVAAAAPAAPPVPAAPPATPTAPTAPVAPAAAGISFGQLATKLEPHFVSGRLTWDAVNPILAKFGLQQFNQLMHAPALAPLVDGEISALLGLAPGVPS